MLHIPEVLWAVGISPAKQNQSVSTRTSLNVFTAVILTIFVIFLTSCGDSPAPSSASDPAVDAVKNGALYFYPSKTLGGSLAGFLTDIKWESLVADDGFTYVNVSGGALYYDKPVTIEVQYKLNNNDSFEFNAIELNGVPHDLFTYYELIIVSYEEELISIVKNGGLDAYPGRTLGRVFSSFFDDIEWDLVVDEDYIAYVNITGTLLHGGVEATAVLQYQVDTVDLTFIYNAFEIDGIPQHDSKYFELIELVFEGRSVPSSWWDNPSNISNQSNTTPSQADSDYSGVVLFDGIPILHFFDCDIYDIWDSFGRPFEAGYTLYYAYSSYDGVVFNYLEETGEIIFIEIYKPDKVTIDEITLDKNRAGLVALLGEPDTGDIYGYDGWIGSSYVLEYVEWPFYVLTFEMSAPNNIAYLITFSIYDDGDW